MPLNYCIHRQGLLLYHLTIQVCKVVERVRSSYAQSWNNDLTGRYMARHMVFHAKASSWLHFQISPSL